MGARAVKARRGSPTHEQSRPSGARGRGLQPWMDGTGRAQAGDRSTPGEAFQALLERSCGALLPGPPAGHSCRALLPSTPAEHSCRALLPTTPAEHSCRGLLPTTPAEDSPGHSSLRGLPSGTPTEHSTERSTQESTERSTQELPRAPSRAPLSRRPRGDLGVLGLRVGLRPACGRTKGRTPSRESGPRALYVAGSRTRTGTAACRPSGVWARCRWPSCRQSWSRRCSRGSRRRSPPRSCSCAC